MSFHAIQIAAGEVASLEDVAASLERLERLCDALSVAADLDSASGAGALLLDLSHLAGELGRYVRAHEAFAWTSDASDPENVRALVMLALRILDAHVREPDRVGTVLAVPRAAAAVLTEAALALGARDGPGDDHEPAEARLDAA